MDRKHGHTQIKNRTMAIWSLVGAVLLIALVCGISVAKLKQDLYEERAYNSGRVMNKIAANIQTVVKMREEHVVFDASLIADREFAGDHDAAGYLAKLEKTGSTDGNHDVLLLIDKSGTCLASDGTLFRWEESGILNTNERKILVSSVNALGLSEEQVLFVTPLPRDVETDDRTFTHICLIMEQSVMSHYLSQAHYVEQSALFIIQNDGTYLYRQAEGSVFSNVFNLITNLERWRYLYKTSAEQTIHNIQNQTDGCACVSVDGDTYFAIYGSLHINDWTAVYLVPESGASSNSSNFMSSIVRTVLLLALIVMAVITGFLIASHFHSMEQQSQINEQLRRAVEAEHSANNAKTRFLSSMSHDIRTPMNAIVGMTALAERHIDDSTYVKDCLSKIQLASDHLLTLINDILDISKIESGKMTLNPTVFSLPDSVNNMFNIVRPQVKAKNQTLDIHIESIIHEYLMADELRLNQIFINILTNAIKYTPESGRITVTLREALDPERKSAVRLTYIVQDTGIGMSEEFMDNMYGSFSRSTDSRVSRIQGTGLGLAICKQLVELMDGTIECDSTIGKGTRFTITLRFSTAEHPSGDYKLPGLNLLLVDDDEMFLESASEILREMDVVLETAESSHEALSKVAERCARGEAYFAILMDWKMADLDGIETLKRIHATIDAEIPIILISAYDSTDIEQLALDAGAAGFMRKPFFKASLFQQMNQYLQISDMDTSENEEIDLEGMHILVAEDNDLNWEIAKELLDMSGVHTERTENGQQCVERLQAAFDGEFDAVLMDVQMPVMDGKEATRILRASGRDYLLNLPIIAMTADAFAEDISACLEAGMNDHISKPINLDKLFSELRKINHRKKGDRS